MSYSYFKHNPLLLQESCYVVVKCGERKAVYNLMIVSRCFSELENLGCDLQKCFSATTHPTQVKHENERVLELANCPSSRLDKLCYSFFPIGRKAFFIENILDTFLPSLYQKHKVIFLTLYIKNLVGFLEIKTMKVWGPRILTWHRSCWIPIQAKTLKC